MPSPFVVIDTTASDRTGTFLLSALKRGGWVVISNKRPLTATQREFERLKNNKLFFETTVGAGLPVIRSIQALQWAGDTITEIRACLSGTLGFLCARMDEGISFSKAIRMAKDQGLTEPDPRDDLSGADVARKTLILLRLLGHRDELSNIQRPRLYPASMDSLTTAQFIDATERLNPRFAGVFAKAKHRGNTIRYLATVKADTAGLQMKEVPIASDAGHLKGADNLVVIHTSAYRTQPLVIKGPGAGIDVTALGVIADLLEVTKQL